MTVVDASPLTLAVIAKAPLPGRAKTRLSPPCTPEQAAAIASALLADVLAVARHVAGVRLVVLFDGEPTAWLPEGVPVVQQRAGGIDQRLELAFQDLPSPALIVAADADVGVSDVHALVEPLVSGDVDAALGPAHDGGYWAIGLARPIRDAVRGVPMNAAHTGAAQLDRLHQLGLRVHVGPCRRDVDTFDDALAVAAARPTGHLAACLAALGLDTRPGDDEGTAA
jgi:uncharacterized protein